MLNKIKYLLTIKKKGNMECHIHNSDISLHNVLIRIFSRTDDPGGNTGTLTFVVSKNSPFLFILGLKKGKQKSVCIVLSSLSFLPTEKIIFIVDQSYLFLLVFFPNLK
jgi:hypothetical protein